MFRERERERETKRKMKREGKSGQGVVEKEENLGEKLRRGVLVGKSGGPSTPIVSAWRLWPSLEAHDSIIKEDNAHLSARKLTAALWAFHHYFSLPKMQRGVGINGAGECKMRRQHHYKDKGIDLSHFLADPSPSSPEQPESASSLRRHIAQSVIQHHGAIKRSNHALQPVSPASYGSSLAMGPYNPAVTPTSSLDFKGRVGESRYNVKTSTELLKVLNRIWSLEEQHGFNVALIKALKTKLNHARVRIKELHRGQQADWHEIDDLMKQIAEDKLVRKSKEQDRIRAVQSVKDELEDERKLRKRSESLHRKLAQDLSEVKYTLSNHLKELEREKRSRMLLEELCDEFAMGIKHYEQEVHARKQKYDQDWVGKTDHDRLILHISESWLDERMQMKLEVARSGFTEKKSIVDKVGFDIETFLRAKRMSASKRTDHALLRDRRNSIESVPLNEAMSAPQAIGDEEDCSDSNCFELNNPIDVDLKFHRDEAVGNNIDKTLKHGQTKKSSASRERISGRNPSSLQVKFEEQMAWAISCNGNKEPQMANAEPGKDAEEKPDEKSTSQKPENCGAIEDDIHERNIEHDEVHGSNINYMIDNLIRNHILLSEAGGIHPENDSAEASCSYPVRRNQASPVCQWTSTLKPPDIDISKSSTKVPAAPKENTLKAKLLEERSKGQRSQFRLCKAPS